MGNPKLCVAGVGAIGTLIAAMLGKKYADSLSVIARGKRADSFREKGLVLHSDFYGEVVSQPANIEENGEALGVQDFVFVCVKNYSLDAIAKQIAPCIGPDTVIVPVMNGIEPGDRLRKLFPQAHVLDSVIYTITGAQEDFSAKQSGTYTYMFLGTKDKDETSVNAAHALHEIMRSVDFDCRFAEDIEAEIWRKYILNCAFNTITARYKTSIGPIREDPEKLKDIRGLFEEAYAVSKAIGISLPEDLIEKQFTFMTTKQSPKATSSMERDVSAGRPTELDAFLGSLIRKAKEYSVDVPVCTRYYNELKDMSI
ncbi:ketopantoate reductase family protein [Schwartzia sp. (in: firmicutes)]